MEYIQEPVMGEVETKEKHIILHKGKSEVAKINIVAIYTNLLRLLPFLSIVINEQYTLLKTVNNDVA